MSPERWSPFGDRPPAAQPGGAGWAMVNVTPLKTWEAVR
jgi:hypothetical protein